MRPAGAIAALAFVFVGVAAGAPAATVLKFTTIAHDSKPAGSDEPSWDVMKVGDVHASIVPNAGQMTYWYYAFPTADERKFDALNWNTHFVFAAWMKQRTSGYKLTIKRVAVQRISRTARQLCLIASIEKPRPGEAVVVRPSFSAHAVAMSSARFRVDHLHWAIPTRFVLRNTTGALLTVSRVGGARNNSFVSSKPKLCRVNVRGSDDESVR